MYKTLTTALRASENRPASLRSSNGFPLARFAGLPPQFGWSIKRKALLWAGLGLTLTNLHILCRMCTVAEQPVLIVVLLMKGLLFRALLSHHTVGGRWCRKAPKGESHRRWLIDVMVFMPYDIESQSRNADFISIARRAIHNPRANGPSNLRTLRTLRTKSRQPSRRRRVHRRQPRPSFNYRRQP